MKFLLRPICWLREHARLVEQVWEAMPFGTLVCSRCHKPADDRVQIAWMKKLLNTDTGSGADE